MRPALITLFLIITYRMTYAQPNYDVSLIPKELLPYASAVIRNEEISTEVKDIDNVVYHVKRAVTVLNKNGDDMAHMAVYYNKNIIIKYIKGAAFNEFGKPIRKFSEHDFLDQATFDGFSLFEDYRVKHYIPAITEYPYTIEYEYEVRDKQTLNFRDWEPQAETNLAVEKSTFIFSSKPDFIIRYKEDNTPEKVTTGSNSQGFKTYTWQAKGLKANKYEPYAPYYARNFISVKIAPEKFSYFGISGSFTNWKELGKWNYDNLVASRQELRPETVEHIKEITKDIADPKLKAKKIYEYMQSKTHYVSVQIGIGGYQPFLAADVDKQNYGDCKALVNYTQALLNAVDIPSYYCVVEAGTGHKVSFLKDFASMQQGNHIILCLPFKNDTTWAECTSQTIPFGFLGDFTDDRTVLACTPEGGRLMHTPKYTFKDNEESRKASFVVNEAGELSGDMTTTFKGTVYNDHSYYLLRESRKEQDKILQKFYPINNLLVDNFDIEEGKSACPVTTEKISLHARDYASIADSKFYFMLNSVNREESVPREVLNRVNNVYINRGYTEEDEITYTIPSGYHLEEKPVNITLDKPFGKFSAYMELNGDKLFYKRKLQIFDGTYDKDLYEDLVYFYQNIFDADGYTVSLIKNN